MRSRHEPSEERRAEPQGPEDQDRDAWVLLAETRTVRVLGKRPASRKTQSDQTNSGSDGNPSQPVVQRAARVTTEIVVPGRQHL